MVGLIFVPKNRNRHISMAGFRSFSKDTSGEAIKSYLVPIFPVKFLLLDPDTWIPLGCFHRFKGEYLMTADNSASPILLKIRYAPSKVILSWHSSGVDKSRAKPTIDTGTGIPPS